MIELLLLSIQLITSMAVLIVLKKHSTSINKKIKDLPNTRKGENYGDSKQCIIDHLPD